MKANSKRQKKKKKKEKKKKTIVTYGSFNSSRDFNRMWSLSLTKRKERRKINRERKICFQI